jgi:hypothetical protein
VATIYIFVALLLAGWSFRLMVFGWVYSTDVFLLRSLRAKVGSAVPAFSAALPGVPARTYGKLARSSTGLSFTFRPWLVLPARTVPVESVAPLAIGRAFLAPVVLEVAAPNEERVLLRFSPRFRPHTDAIAQALGGLESRDVGVIRGLRAGIAWAKRQWNRRPRLQAAIQPTA